MSRAAVQLIFLCLTLPAGKHAVISVHKSRGAIGEEKKGFFSRLKEGPAKTRNNIVYGIDNGFNGFPDIDEDFYEELEEVLIMGDMGIRATDAVLENLRMQLKGYHIKEPADCREFLIRNIREQMDAPDTVYHFLYI